jgi:hypothetical protein
MALSHLGHGGRQHHRQCGIEPSQPQLLASGHDPVAGRPAKRRSFSAMLRPNNSFKPKPLRSGKNMAEKACHVFTSTTRFGLTQALGA